MEYDIAVPALYFISSFWDDPDANRLMALTTRAASAITFPRPDIPD